MASKVMQRVHGRGGQFVRGLTKQELLAYYASRDAGDDGTPHFRNASTDGSSASVTTISTGSTQSSSKNRREHPPLYAVVSDSIALEKTKQSFRHQKRVLSHQGRHPTREELGMQSDIRDVKIETRPKPTFSIPLAISQLKIPHSVHANRDESTQKGNYKVTPPICESVVPPARIQPFGSPLSAPSPIFHPQQVHVANSNVQSTSTTRLVEDCFVQKDLTASTATSSIGIISALSEALKMEQKKHHDASMALLLARRSVLSQMIASTAPQPSSSSSSLAAAAAATAATAAPASFQCSNLGTPPDPSIVPFLSSTNIVAQASRAAPSATVQDLILLLLSQNSRSSPSLAATINQESFEKERLIQLVSSALRQVDRDTPANTGIHGIALPSFSTTERLTHQHNQPNNLELLAALSVTDQRLHHHLM